MQSSVGVHGYQKHVSMGEANETDSAQIASTARYDSSDRGGPGWIWCDGWLQVRQRLGWLVSVRRPSRLGANEVVPLAGSWPYMTVDGEALYGEPDNR